MADIESIGEVDSIKTLEEMYYKRFEEYFKRSEGLRLRRGPHFTKNVAKSGNQKIRIDVMGYLHEGKNTEGSPAHYGKVSQELGHSILKMNLALSSTSALSPTGLGILVIVDDGRQSAKSSRLFIPKEKMDDALFYVKVLKQVKKIYGIV